MASIHPRGLVTLLTVLGTCAAQAQTLYLSGKELERRAFSSTTTYVQLLGDADYDRRLREALSGPWTLTRGIEFVEPGEPLGDAEDERRSYLSIWRLHESGSRSFLVLWQGGKVWSKDGDGTGGYSDADYWKSWVVAVPIDAVGRETKDEYVAWRLPLVIRTIIQLVDYARIEQPSVGRMGMEAEDVKGLNSTTLAGKTLLLWKGRFTNEQITLIRDLYPHKTEAVDMDVILEAIANHDPAYAILVLAQAGGHSNLSAHDAARGDLLFSAHEYEPMKNYALSEKMLKGLAKATK